MFSNVIFDSVCNLCHLISFYFILNMKTDYERFHYWLTDVLLCLLIVLLLNALLEP